MKFITFVNIEAARESETYLLIARGGIKFENVKGVYLTFGENDVVVIHEGEDLATGVRTAVKIRNIPGVLSTKTIVCLDVEEVFG
ncbi:Lrp/AsnC ligand binding domain-containing protein [[Eubacterium] cellulosolvens]